MPTAASAQPKVASHHAAQGLRAAVGRHFKAWDVDGNGHLSRDEVDLAMQNPTLHGDDAAAAATLKLWYSLGIKVRHSKGLSEADLRGHLGKADDGNSPAGIFKILQERARNVPRGLFSGAVRGGAKIDPFATMQGYVSSCCLLATVVGLAVQHPAAVTSLMAAEDDGRFSVRLRGRTVHIDRPTDAQVILYSRTRNDGLWLSVLEKAVAVQKAGVQRHSSPFDGPTEVHGRGGPIDPYDAFLNGMSFSDAMLAVTGHYQVSGLSLGSECKLKKLRRALRHAVRHKHVMVASTHLDPRRWTPQPGISHVFTVLGYKRGKDCVELRNPRGMDEPVDAAGRPLDGRDDGRFTLSLRDFRKYFERFASAKWHERWLHLA